MAKIFETNAAVFLKDAQNSSNEATRRGRLNLRTYSAKKHKNEADIFNTSTPAVNSLVLVRVKNNKRSSKNGPWYNGPYQVYSETYEDSTVNLAELARDKFLSVHVNRLIPFDSSLVPTWNEQAQTAATDFGLYFVPISFSNIEPTNAQLPTSLNNSQVTVKWLNGDKSKHPARDFKANGTFQHFLTTQHPSTRAIFKVPPANKIHPAVAKRPPEATGNDYIGDAADPTNIDSELNSFAQLQTSHCPGGIVIQSRIKVSNSDSESFFNTPILLDTGAQRINAISEKLAQKIELKTNQARSTAPTVIHAYNSMPTSHNGYLTLHVSLPSADECIEFTAKFIVVNNLSPDLIIGDSTIAQLKLIRSDFKPIQDKIESAAKVNYDNSRVTTSKMTLSTDNKKIDLTSLYEDDDNDESLPHPHLFPDHVSTEPRPPHNPQSLPKRLTLTELFEATEPQLELALSKLEKFSDIVFKLDTGLSPKQTLWCLIFFRQYDVFDSLFQSELGSALKHVTPMNLKVRKDCEHMDIFANPRPTTNAQKDTIDKMLELMLDKGIIRESDNPRFYAPIHVVKYTDPTKKDRTTIGKSFGTFSPAPEHDAVPETAATSPALKLRSEVNTPTKRGPCARRSRRWAIMVAKQAPSVDRMANIRHQDALPRRHD